MRSACCAVAPSLKRAKPWAWPAFVCICAACGQKNAGIIERLMATRYIQATWQALGAQHANTNILGPGVWGLGG